MVAQVVPPPFAEKLSISVFGYQVAALEQGQQLIGWHYIHRAPGAFNPEPPLAQRRLMPSKKPRRTKYFILFFLESLPRDARRNSSSSI